MGLGDLGLQAKSLEAVEPPERVSQLPALHRGARGAGRAAQGAAGGDKGRDPEHVRAAPSAAGRGQPLPARRPRPAPHSRQRPRLRSVRGQCGVRVLVSVQQSTSCLSFPVCIPPLSGLAEGHEGARAMPGASPAPCPGWGLGSSFVLGSTRSPSRLPTGAGGKAGWRWGELSG